MKKFALTALAVSVLSASAVAAPVGETFKGWGVGLDLTSTKYEDAKRATGVGVIVDYGFDYGNNFVGLVEGKLKFNNSTLVDEKSDTEQVKIQEKYRFNLSYLQGYRVLPDLLPYVKLGYSVTQFKGESTKFASGSYSHASVSETKSGWGYGVGVKYAVSSNVELGAEYFRSHVKFDGESVKANTLGANISYRF